MRNTGEQQMKVAITGLLRSAVTTRTRRFRPAANFLLLHTRRVNQPTEGRTIGFRE